MLKVWSVQICWISIFLKYQNQFYKKKKIKLLKKRKKEEKGR